MWGYIYFHVNNILWYLTFREFSPPERYDSATNSYKKGKFNKVNAYALLTTLGVVKIIEIVHAVLMKDRIKNGKVIEEGFIFEPVIYSHTESSELTFGIRYCYRFK